MGDSVFRRSAFVVVALTGVLAAPAADIKPRASLVHLHNGINRVDFTGDGDADLVVLGYRNNFNAHGFDVASFCVLAAPFGESDKRWKIVPLINKDHERLEVTVAGGVECLLHDFRLSAGTKADSATLSLADREIGDSFSDSRRVTFTYYTLKTNYDGVPGEPLYWFEKSRSTKSKATYCDVGEAFKQELGIGEYRSDR